MAGRAATKEWPLPRPTTNRRTREQGLTVMYSFGEAVMNENDLTLSREQLSLSRFTSAIDLPRNNPLPGLTPATEAGTAPAGLRFGDQVGKVAPSRQQ